MKRLFFSAFLIGCSSASSSGGTLSPGGIDAQGPSDDPATRIPPPSPPPSSSGFTSPGSSPTPRGCPSIRSLQEDASQMPSIEELRALLVGIYRECSDATGLELRIDPNDATHILWYRLDDRFVRMNGMQQSGFLTIDQCSDYSCTLTWHVDDAPELNGYRSLELWRDPIAIVVESSVTNVRNDWVHVAK